MTYNEMFSKVKDMLSGVDVSRFREHLAYQFNLSLIHI